MHKTLRTLPLLLLAALTLTACEANEKKNPVITTGTVNIGPASDFPAGGANTNFLTRYGIVIVNSAGTPLAVRAQCTLDHAKLTWDPKIDQFVCHENGCRYDILGRVTHGPATKALPGVVAQKQPDATLTVDLTKLYGM